MVALKHRAGIPYVDRTGGGRGGGLLLIVVCCNRARVLSPSCTHRRRAHDFDEGDQSGRIMDSILLL